MHSIAMNGCQVLVRPTGVEQRSLGIGRSPINGFKFSSLIKRYGKTHSEHCSMGSNNQSNEHLSLVHGEHSKRNTAFSVSSIQPVLAKL